MNLLFSYKFIVNLTIVSVDKDLSAEQFDVGQQRYILAIFTFENTSYSLLVQISLQVLIIVLGNLSTD